MDDLNQKKLEVIFNILAGSSLNAMSERPYYQHVSKQILSTLSQFDELKIEPLEVTIRYDDIFKCWKIRFMHPIHSMNTTSFIFEKEQEAIDFCKLHGLKIKE